MSRPYGARCRAAPRISAAQQAQGAMCRPACAHQASIEGRAVASASLGCHCQCGMAAAKAATCWHVAAVQFAQPEVTISFDTDSRLAAVQRKGAYADAAKGRYLVAGAHLPFPGIGHIRAEGKSYAWVPLDYKQVR